MLIGTCKKQKYMYLLPIYNYKLIKRARARIMNFGKSNFQIFERSRSWNPLQFCQNNIGV